MTLCTASPLVLLEFIYSVLTMFFYPCKTLPRLMPPGVLQLDDDTAPLVASHVAAFLLDREL